MENSYPTIMWTKLVSFAHLSENCTFLVQKRTNKQILFPTDPIWNKPNCGITLGKQIKNNIDY